MRKLIYGMNLTLDGYVAAPGDDLGWSGPSDELFQWWLDQELAAPVCRQMPARASLHPLGVLVNRPSVWPER